jgi:hypothetical protein
MKIPLIIAFSSLKFTTYDYHKSKKISTDQGALFENTAPWTPAKAFYNRPYQEFCQGRHPYLFGVRWCCLSASPALVLQWEEKKGARQIKLKPLIITIKENTIGY